jgi:hypothetical protein
MRTTLLRDIEPILSKPEISFSIKLCIKITNVSDFTWPVGLSFKLVGAGKDSLANFDLTNNVEIGEDTELVWEFGNRCGVYEEKSNDLHGLIKVLR